ncbi:VOC family protein [Nostoc sp. CHAB 5715]|uniref:VOC family protein n=1 Tax=Nostoc sp. CHAB 5715 TaxID=2780400 RepID=UPI001E58932F|nr:hypothetical protein [Nostoc sp. CHAB 5715]MCC5619962.1 hypothetical protein [Nostoc sp. CHAB 5715]
MSFWRKLEFLLLGMKCLYVYLHQAEKKLMRWLLPALAADGATYNEPQDHSFMYGHGFADLNRHIWEIIYMEPSAIKRG